LVQSLLSLQSASVAHVHVFCPGLHTPASQKSPVVHGLLSSQLPSVALFWQTPVTHALLVHGFESSQPLFERHAQAEVSCWQTPAAQVSMLQARPSSQLIDVPAHEPPEQASFVVQASLSLQDRVLSV
jgi:hypothetical protein